MKLSPPISSRLLLPQSVGEEVRQKRLEESTCMILYLQIPTKFRLTIKHFDPVDLYSMHRLCLPKRNVYMYHLSSEMLDSEQNLRMHC